MSGAYNQDRDNRFFSKKRPVHQIYYEENNLKFLMGVAINPNCKNIEKLFHNYLLSKNLNEEDFEPRKIQYLEYNSLSGEWVEEYEGSNPQKIIWYEAKEIIIFRNLSNEIIERLTEKGIIIDGRINKIKTISDLYVQSKVDNMTSKEMVDAIRGNKYE